MVTDPGQNDPATGPSKADLTPTKPAERAHCPLGAAPAGFVILEIMLLPLPKPAPSIEQLLDGAVDALDKLMAEVRGGIRGPEHFDRLEAEATRIGGSLRDAFRRGCR